MTLRLKLLLRVVKRREVGRRTEGLPETERGGEEADAGTADRQSFIKKELRQKRFAAAFGL